MPSFQGFIKLFNHLKVAGARRGLARLGYRTDKMG